MLFFATPRTTVTVVIGSHKAKHDMRGPQWDRLLYFERPAQKIVTTDRPPPAAQPTKAAKARQHTPAEPRPAQPAEQPRSKSSNKQRQRKPKHQHNTRSETAHPHTHQHPSSHSTQQHTNSRQTAKAAQAAAEKVTSDSPPPAALTSYLSLGAPLLHSSQPVPHDGRS